MDNILVLLFVSINIIKKEKVHHHQLYYLTDYVITHKRIYTSTIQQVYLRKMCEGNPLLTVTYATV